ncbi:MAG: 16S rRNA (cytidine(1402)-2'-O)-methyltransferase [Candidatus Margulisiibacteriota bacterium]
MQKKTGSLYVCGTPIGNLKDCTERLKETLTNVDLIAAEDTRRAQILLAHFGIKKKCISLEKYNEAKRINYLKELLFAGNDIALISEAGTPNIADPGAYLIANLLDENIKIIPIPGASSLTSLISISGVLANQFIFLSFCPKKKLQLEKHINLAKVAKMPLVYFETGKRLIKTLNLLQEIEPKIELFLTKELTKIHERYFRGTVAQIIEQLEKTSLKGEWCFLLKI